MEIVQLPGNLCNRREHDLPFLLSIDWDMNVMARLPPALSDQEETSGTEPLVAKQQDARSLAP